MSMIFLTTVNLLEQNRWIRLRRMVSFLPVNCFLKFVFPGSVGKCQV